ncbi:unnamed protein product [Closterium sp. NIES-54]
MSESQSLDHWDRRACASESSLPGPVLTEALHTFTLDSGASRCFFCDCTTLTPLLPPVPVRLADPSGGPVVARSSTVLPCPAVPSSSLSSLHLTSFSTNLVSTTALQDAMVTTTAPGGQRVSICTCTRTGCHLATFTRQPGLSLYTLATKPPRVAASAQVSASGQVAPPCSCRLLSHQTLLWHHRLGHPSLLRLGGMHSRLLVFGLPRSLRPLLPSPTPPCLPCVEGRQHGAPHSSTGSARTFPSYVCTLTEVPCFSLRWTRKIGDASVFQVWGSCAFVRDTSADKLSARAIPCVLLGFSPDAPGWQFNHPTSQRVFPSLDVTFDESVPFYCLFPYCSAPPPPPPLFLATGAARGATFGGAEPGGAESAGTGSGGAEPQGAEPAGMDPRGAEPDCVEPGGVEPAGVEPGGAESEGAESGGAEPRGSASSGVC